MFAVFDDVISLDDCIVLKERIQSWYFNCLTENSKEQLWNWKRRALDVTPEHLSFENNSTFERNFSLDLKAKEIQEKTFLKVKKLIETRCNLELQLESAELQTWPMNTDGPAHIHDGYRSLTDFNSLLYLNDDFDGGEFYTEDGIIVRPKPGRLTFFDGSKVKHGVNEIYNGNRFTMIFWWKKTKFK